MIKLKQLILGDACLDCRGCCCHYEQEDTIWSPFFMREEMYELADNNIVLPSVFSGIGLHCGETARPHLVKHEGIFLCPCFDIKENKCKIYLHRPFECQLYPFLLAQKDDTVYLAVAENCPYMQQPGRKELIEEHIRYLMDMLSSEYFLRLAKNNPGIVQDYGQEVAYLVPLPELTRVIHVSSAARPQR
ncbi:MAG TPA: hypothetical protein DCL35_01370 [Candidatus Omnitrophica bacterium]|nr:hypothetical protein [Candidatus Omnitrophota bacterium]